MSEASDPRRVELLAECTSPVVHKLNNLLAIISGSCDAWARHVVSASLDRAEAAQLIQASVTEAVRILGGLSDLSKPEVTDRAEAADLRVVLETVRDLARPFAAERGVSLQVESVGGEATLSVGARRVSRALLLVVLSAVSVLGERGRHHHRRRVRLRAWIGVDRVALGLSWDSGELPLEDAERARLRADLAWLGELDEGGAPRERWMGSVGAARVLLKASVHLAAPGEAGARPQPRLVLAEPDELFAEMLASVLAEEGFQVSTHAQLPESGDAVASRTLVLDAGLAARRPEQARELARASRHTLLLGERVPALEGLATVLEKPFGTEELIAALRPALG